MILRFKRLFQSQWPIKPSMILLLTGSSSDGATSTLFQASSVNNFIVDEYLKSAQTPEEIRDAFTDMMGDLLMTLPIVSVAGYHSGQQGSP